jgi:hypothetical protein
MTEAEIGQVATVFAAALDDVASSPRA